MPERRTLFEAGTIADVPAKVRLSDKEVVKAMFAVEEKHKKALKEAKKESAEDPKAKFQYAHFICVRSGAVIPWQL